MIRAIYDITLILGGLSVILVPYVALALVCWPLSFYVWFWFVLHPIRICIGCVS